MEFPLCIHNFRNELSEELVARGWIYFNTGWVKTPREIMPDYYEAVVEEVNPHAVSYSYDVETGIFTDVFCTCGENSENGCRHLAAVICMYEKQAIDESRLLTWEEWEALQSSKSQDRNSNL
jgi:uncharacterized Zn finger protein